MKFAKAFVLCGTPVYRAIIPNFPGSGKDQTLKWLFKEFRGPKERSLKAAKLWARQMQIKEMRAKNESDKLSQCESGSTESTPDAGRGGDTEG